MLRNAARISAQLLGTRSAACVQEVSTSACAVEARRCFRSASASAAAPTAPTTDFEIATGLELKELEAAAKGEPPLFEQDLQWLNVPVGTLANPVQVTSTLASRIVGATDIDDDSIIHWGLVEEGKPPVKIGEEYFVLKRTASDAHHDAHH